MNDVTFQLAWHIDRTYECTGLALNVSAVHSVSMDLSRAIKDSITAEMTRQGVSQRELARRLGVRQEYVWLRLSPSEKADVELTPSDIERIAEALEVTVDKLLPTAATR